MMFKPDQFSGRGRTFAVSFVAALLLQLSPLLHTDVVMAAQGEARQLAASAAVAGRPDLAIRTRETIQGFQSATQGSDGAIISYDRLTGSGDIDTEHVIIEGEISPGNSPGCINFGGNVTLNTSATLLIEIGGTVMCTEYDRLSVANVLTINSATLQVTLINSFIPSLGQRFDVLDWGSLTGSFGYVDLTAAPLTGDLFWDTSTLYTTGQLIVGSPDDTDSDGILDYLDNCILRHNPAQRDTDDDGYGNYCDPDFDNSGVVNAADLAYLKTMFFTTDALADLNGDGIVNAADLAILKTMFFKPPGPSGLVP